MVTKTDWRSMMRKFSWMLLVLLAFGGCGEVDDECCGPPPTLTAIPSSGSQVAANATITLVFDYPVESVTNAIGAGKKWTITPPQVTMHIIWINLDGTEGRQTLNYKLKVDGAPFRRIY